MSISFFGLVEKAKRVERECVCWWTVVKGSSGEEQEFGKRERCEVWFYSVSGLVLTEVVN